MENKQSMIEEWAKKVEHSKKQELSKEAANHFMMVCLNAKKIDEDNMLDCPNMFGKSIWEIKEKNG